MEITRDIRIGAFLLGTLIPAAPPCPFRNIYLIIYFEKSRRANARAGRDASDLRSEQVALRARERGVAWYRGVEVTREVSLDLPVHAKSEDARV